MPAPRPPSPAELIAYTKATGKLYTTVHNDEHYFNLTGERVPWYKTPTKKPETAFEQNRREVNEKKILDRRKKPTEAEQEAKAVEGTTEKIKRENAFAEATKKRSDRLAQEKKDFQGEPSRKAVTRINRDISSNVEESAQFDEIIARQDEIINTSNDPGLISDAKIERGRLIEQRDLIDNESFSKSDSLSTITRASKLGFKNVGEVYAKRNQAKDYIRQYDQTLMGMAMQLLEQELGFKPADDYLATPKGQEIFRAAALQVRDQADAQIQAGFNYKQAREFLNATEPN